MHCIGCPCGSAGKESTCKVGDLGSISGDWKGCPLQYFGLGNSIDCIVDGMAKSPTQREIFNFTFLGGLEGKKSACNAGDRGSVPGSGSSPGEGKGYLLQYSCLEYPMHRETWQDTGHGVSKNLTRLSD